jgi:hypothetical protein
MGDQWAELVKGYSGERKARELLLPREPRSSVERWTAAELVSLVERGEVREADRWKAERIVMYLRQDRGRLSDELWGVAFRLVWPAHRAKVSGPPPAP